MLITESDDSDNVILSILDAATLPYLGHNFSHPFFPSFWLPTPGFNSPPSTSPQLSLFSPPSPYNKELKKINSFSSFLKNNR